MRAETSTPYTPPDTKFFKYSANTLFFISSVYISLRIIYDYLRGGDPWKQGDWLINNAAGPIRRGPFGSAIISVSDFLNLNPLLIVSIIQISFIIILYISFRKLVTKISNPKIYTILIFSSALFLIFWIADIQGSARKELIAYSSLTLFALGTLSEKKAILWLGVALFCIITISHEAMVLFAPTFLIIAILSDLHKALPNNFGFSIATIFYFSAFSLFLAIRNLQMEDTTEICAALVSRGLDESICGGAIRWLSHDSIYGFEQVISRLNPQSLRDFLISYVAALTPFFYLIWLSNRRALSGAALLLLALPYAPLYIFAVDWGRWISFHTFSCAIVFACAIIKGHIEIQRPVSNFCLLALVVLSILVSPKHTIGAVWGGAARRAISDFWSLLS